MNGVRKISSLTNTRAARTVTRKNFILVYEPNLSIRLITTQLQFSSARNQLAQVDLSYHNTAPVKDRFPPPNCMHILNVPSGAFAVV